MIAIVPDLYPAPVDRPECKTGGFHMRHGLVLVLAVFLVGCAVATPVPVPTGTSAPPQAATAPATGGSDAGLGRSICAYRCA
jgi:hypothetical protein